MSHQDNSRFTKFDRLSGLIAAPFTPYSNADEVAYDRIDDYATFLSAQGVSGVFVCGTTGEGVSLSVAERRLLLETWVAAARGKNLKVIAHVGHSSVRDATSLAEHAAGSGADAVAAMPSSRFLPADVDVLVQWCANVCSHIGEVPFYYYHIPSVSGVAIPMRKFLAAASEQLPNLVGVKFTYEDMLDYQMCCHFEDGAFDMAFGRDEFLLGALAIGARSAVGSTYNFATPLYLKVIAEYQKGSMKEAQRAQTLATRMISILVDFGGLPAIKAAMGFIGMDMGPMRSPMSMLDRETLFRLRAELTKIGFFAFLESHDASDFKTSQNGTNAPREKVLLAS